VEQIGLNVVLCFDEYIHADSLLVDACGKEGRPGGEANGGGSKHPK
jgi:hypothetical protein